MRSLLPCMSLLRSPLGGFVLAFCLGITATADQGSWRRSCGTKSLSPEQFLADEAAIRAIGNATSTGRHSTPLGLPSTVDLYFHVVTAGEGLQNGYLTAGMVANQIRVLNTDFSSTGVSFNLAGLSYTTNGRWRNIGGDDDPATKEMKTSLRKGGSARTLNVYATSLVEGVLGFSSLPSDYADNPTLDGVVVNSDTIPKVVAARLVQHSRGSPLTRARRIKNSKFGQGRTLVHEVGHYLGLYHTFEGGCSAQNDGVADTPAQRESSNGCPIGQDTCTGPGFEGADDVTNFMDYSDDNCMTHFTPGQIVRMGQMWTVYRART